MMALYFTLLAMMTALSPTSDPIARHGRLATSMAIVLTAEPALYRDDDDRRRSAALLVAVAFRESSLQHDAIGDGGHSVCALQIYGGSPALLDDTDACVRTGYRMLRTSIAVDRTHPVAHYARGPRFKSDEARRISRDRTDLAERLLRTVQ